MPPDEPAASLSDQGRSREYHTAHLAFARSHIVEVAARRGSIFDLLREYTNDVVKSERDRVCSDLDRLAAENEALTDAAERAAGMLAMTQCPYFQNGEPCTTGCCSEPACQTDQPLEGWIVGALSILTEALDEGCDDISVTSDEQEASGA